MLKKAISFILLFIFCLGYVSASEVNVESKRYIIYNMNENKIIDEKDAYTSTDIASLTKIMTVIVAIENINDYNAKITITSDMLNGIDWDVAVTGFKVGQVVTYNDLLYASILNSGADAVQALAISISKDKDKFVDLMNQKVKDLGLKNTKFANVVGLYDENNYSSAYDMAQLLIYSLKNKKFKEVFETKEYDLSIDKKVKSTIYTYSQNTDLDLSYIKGAKTGYINAAGYCLATNANINGVEYILITLNAHSNTKSVHVKDTVKIYNYFGDNYSYKDVVNKNDIVVRLKTKYAKEKEINIHSGIEIYEYLKNDFDKSKLKYEYTGKNIIDAFTKKGSKIGKIKVIYNEEILSEFDLMFNDTLNISILGLVLYYKKYILIGIIIIFVLIILKGSKRKR